MNKKLLIELAAKRANLPQREAADAVAAVFDLITSSIERGIPVSIRGFGTFYMRERKPRLVRHHQSGTTIRTHAAMAPHFRPSRTLRRQMRNE